MCVCVSVRAGKGEGADTDVCIEAFRDRDTVRRIRAAKPHWQVGCSTCDRIPAHLTRKTARRRLTQHMCVYACLCACAGGQDASATAPPSTQHRPGPHPAQEGQTSPDTVPEAIGHGWSRARYRSCKPVIALCGGARERRKPSGGECNTRASSVRHACIHVIAQLKR